MPVGTDHKITLRQAGAGAGADAGAAADAGADPAPPAAASGAMAEQVVPTATPAAVATPSAVTAASRPRPASPAEQLAPALLTLAKTAGGGQQMTVRLQPADLGMVQVRIAQAASGATRIDITAENPATLLALQRDQPQLHRSLDEAGIAAAGRTITFHVAQAAAGGGANAGHTGSQPGAGGRNSPGSAGGDGATGRDGSAGGGADGSAVGGRGSSGARERTAYPTGRRPGEPVTAADPRGTTSTQLYHIGLDITA